MKNLKSKIRNFTSFLFGDILQNQDNNWSLDNRFENEILTDELKIFQGIYLVRNQLETLDKIKSYVAKKEKLKSEEAQRRLAKEAYIKFKEVGFIDDDCRLIKGVDEAINEVIN